MSRRAGNKSRPASALTLASAAFLCSDTVVLSNMGSLAKMFDAAAMISSTRSLTMSACANMNMRFPTMELAVTASMSAWWSNQRPVACIKREMGSGAVTKCTTELYNSQNIFPLKPSFFKFENACVKASSQ